MKTTVKIMIRVPLLLCAIVWTQSAIAQSAAQKSANANYQNEIGVRVGETSGLAFKHFFGNSTAFEGIAGTWPYSFGVTGLFEKYIPSGVNGLNFYVGGGGHINTGYGRAAYYAYRGDSRYYVYRSGYRGMGIGIDGVMGAEYKIPKIPFALSLDLKPFIEFNNAPDVFFSLDPGLGIKFTF